jgi:hyperosmotically inducible protein
VAREERSETQRSASGVFSPYNPMPVLKGGNGDCQFLERYQAEQGEPTMIMMRTLLLTLALAMGVSACSVFRGQETVKEYTSDAAITTSVKASHAKDPAVAATSIGVETMDGIVQLSGFAKTAEEKSRAEVLARQVKGVKSVRNNIIVRP